MLIRVRPRATITNVAVARVLDRGWIGATRTGRAARAGRAGGARRYRRGSASPGRARVRRPPATARARSGLQRDAGKSADGMVGSPRGRGRSGSEGYPSRNSFLGAEKRARRITRARESLLCAASIPRRSECEQESDSGPKAKVKKGARDSRPRGFESEQEHPRRTARDSCSRSQRRRNARPARRAGVTPAVVLLTNVIRIWK
jgi:hypothetical protein